MARPLKNNADYFPHGSDLRNDRRCKALRNKYGVEGYGVFMMLLEALAGAEFFRMENSSLEIELLAGDFDIESQKLSAIIGYAASLGLIIRMENFISSPLLDDLSKVLSHYREKDRKRKQSGKPFSQRFFQKENSDPAAEETVFHTENPAEQSVFRSENSQSKVNESKEKEIKEKGEKETPPEIFLKIENRSDVISFEISAEILSRCKKNFLSLAPQYYWENRDDEALRGLLQKISSAQTVNGSLEEGVEKKFNEFLSKLPLYWRSKKFTLYHLNQNYNEIITEMQAVMPFPKPVLLRAHVTTQSAADIPVSEEKKKKIREEFLNTICSCYEKFCATGELGILSMNIVYDVLVEKGIVIHSPENISRYRKKALLQIEKRSLFNKNGEGDLKSHFNKRASLTEKEKIIRVENLAKEFAAADFFIRCKSENTDVKNLLLNGTNNR